MSDNSKVKFVYVLLDGVGDLPHPDLKNTTPLDFAKTPNLDRLTKNGAMGEVISVGKGIAPESDIAVFNMLGYKFAHSEYAGRGVIEAIGTGIDFKDGDLALRGNFATLDDSGIIIDRRAGRKIEKEDALAVSKEIEDKIKFSEPGASVVVAPTIGHRVVVRIRCEGKQLSSEITNTDPAYSRVDGMGIAKAVGDYLQIERCLPLNQLPNSELTARLVNEFTEQSLKILRESKTNQNRKAQGKKLLNSILLRDAGNHYPKVVPINDLYSMRFSCIVDMPVEIGISEVLKMRTFNAGGLTDYEEKAKVAAKAMQTENAIYVHLKGPDEFGHDGDAIGKMKNIEEIDNRFFGTLLDNIDTSKVAVIVSADHSTPCINKGHSDDPVPVLVSGDMVKKDSSARYTEMNAKIGSIGLLEGAQVVKTAIQLIK
ncbi:MAG TPA: 2,3-bisphosphoglycerate-independent phosphoglycerate mutase [Candidatus Nitrosotenuis sp.]|nr:2,3-bisphosphoglycerate-independent phosphoglycerate mutase [Candidatus Nitrosotenuis sp.]HIH68683.1 2,3-bisphosphoglycerate-independent phosphoglycerate mutase [Candidatus Nitrosotenuis sp.]HII03947.1 2,3-bisphosphoglycerate-independent phosphoglycerate mutase [Candidatus Nitrosotenuis sp.]